MKSIVYTLFLWLLVLGYLYAADHEYQKLHDNHGAQSDLEIGDPTKVISYETINSRKTMEESSLIHHAKTFHLRIPYLFVGLSSTYSYYLLTKNSVFQERFSRTPYAQSYLTIILVLLETASFLVSLIYTLIGEKLKRYHGAICNWSLLFQTIICSVISILLIVPVDEVLFGYSIMILSFISGGLMASITSASMAISMYLPPHCSQVQITGRRLADLGSSTILFASAFIKASNHSDNSSGDNNNVNDTPINVISPEKITGFCYFISGSVVSFISLLLWSFMLMRSSEYEKAVHDAVHAESSASFSLVKEIFSSWKFAIYPVGITISCIAVEIVAPFFMSTVVSSTTKNDAFFYTTLFRPFAFMVSSIVSFLATFLPSIKFIDSLSTGTVFAISLFMLFVLTPLFCLLNLESTDPNTNIPMYPSAPRLIKSDVIYFVLIVLQMGLFGLTLSLFFKKSTHVDNRLKNTMSTLCSLMVHIGLNIGSLILFGIIQAYSKPKQQ